MIHEQVQKQLNYLKSLVDKEETEKRICEEWGTPYTPSKRKWDNIYAYNEYKKEVETNGDKNLLVYLKTSYGTYPFAKRYVHRSLGMYFYIHRLGSAGDLLANEDCVGVVTFENC